MKDSLCLNRGAAATFVVPELLGTVDCPYPVAVCGFFFQSSLHVLAGRDDEDGENRGGNTHSVLIHSRRGSHLRRVCVGGDGNLSLRFLRVS